MSWIDALCAPEDGPAELAGTLVVVAHPDDETVGAGACLQRLHTARFVYVTDGAPRDGRDAARHGLDVDGYRALRRRERDAALAQCGIDPAQVTDLGCADQAGALHLPALTQALAALLVGAGTRTVLTHPYEGGHPDHDATAFVAHAAVALVELAGAPPPRLVEMASYHNGPHGLEAGTFLPHPQADAEAVLPLDTAARARKQALLACYASQRETLAAVRLQDERFRPAPRHDFREPPHAGALLYEQHPWGMDGPRFRALAADAMVLLGLEGPL
jgi:LmbE family N-acetylglucosaminyl deacetylase